MIYISCFTPNQKLIFDCDFHPLVSHAIGIVLVPGTLVSNTCRNKKWNVKTLLNHANPTHTFMHMYVWLADVSLGTSEFLCNKTLFHMIHTDQNQTNINCMCMNIVWQVVNFQIILSVKLNVLGEYSSIKWSFTEDDNWITPYWMIKWFWRFPPAYYTQGYECHLIEMKTLITLTFPENESTEASRKYHGYTVIQDNVKWGKIKPNALANNKPSIYFYPCYI